MGAISIPKSNYKTILLKFACLLPNSKHANYRKKNSLENSSKTVHCDLSQLPRLQVIHLSSHCWQKGPNNHTHRFVEYSDILPGFL